MPILFFILKRRRDLSKIQEEQVTILRKLERERRREQHLNDQIDVRFFNSIDLAEPYSFFWNILSLFICFVFYSQCRNLKQGCEKFKTKQKMEILCMRMRAQIRS